MKTPEELVAEMEHMISLHRGFMWAVVMQDAVNLIKKEIVKEQSRDCVTIEDFL